MICGTEYGQKVCCELSISIEDRLCRTRKKGKFFQAPEGLEGLNTISPCCCWETYCKPRAIVLCLMDINNSYTSWQRDIILHGRQLQNLRFIFAKVACLVEYQTIAYEAYCVLVSPKR